MIQIQTMNNNGIPQREIRDHNPAANEFQVLLVQNSLIRRSSKSPTVSDGDTFGVPRQPGR